MGIKSTTTLHRSDALERVIEFLGLDLSNEVLGDLLDKLHDAKCEAEGRVSFDNFLVVDDGEPLDR